ncbi:peptidoglycan DD-metalloendopeptidase family protein [Patulibacter brassicae]|uniref:Peptidoglycan DD-metalloendopeptidase family protein n=1 Tax=Patulibacter brassicae TaxID=1705717 RepID=A0ABU4VMF0_9ACTN|nr:peptidoglycan DD-metalloendopeptidase family protein [Patulibacter brassicae]MDX8153021.1 peptidoglycan DD-metalloendopeptidase family protein [Patulibacter brassicae]
MTIRLSRSPRAVLPALGATLLVTAGLALPSGAPPAQAATQQDLDRLRGKIGTARGKVERRKQREQALHGDIQRYSARIQEIQRKIDPLQRRQEAVQSDLDRSQAVLDETQTELREERERLTKLRARLKEARRILAARLLELYQADKPDLVSVVLNSNGFADLVERSEFLRRIGEQDQRIIASVRDARDEAIGTEARLSSLEQRQRAATNRIERRRDEIASVKGQLVSARSSIDEVRDQRHDLLVKVRADRREIQEDLAAMEREESKIQSKLSGMPSGGPIKRGSGRLIWPANGQFTSPFGQRWGRLHAGIDIAVPTGTPVRAADSGTVAIAGWVGGYGNYICINHGGGLSTCYGHNSRLGVRVGQQVTQGQVIAASGNTGNSTGPHIHFETRVNGVPRDPMSYL